MLCSLVAMHFLGILRTRPEFSRSHRPDGNAYCVAPAARLVV